MFSPKPYLLPKRDLEAWIKFIQSPGSAAYNDAAKKKFLGLSQRLLRSFVEHIPLTRDQYSISVNRGGIAVSGDVILQTKVFTSQFRINDTDSDVVERGIYMCFNCDVSKTVYFRTTKGMSDFSGGRNQNIRPEEFRDIPALVDRLLRIKH